MSAILEFNTEPPKQVWIVSRYEPRKRKKVLLTPEDEEKILSSSEYEIVDGEIVERSMPNPQHARIEARITTALSLYVENNPIGEIYTECNFELKKGLIRIPDVAFVSFERFPKDGEPTGSRWKTAPDLAVEIISPTDDYKAVFQKISEYFVNGVRQIWLIEPGEKTLTIYRSRKDVTILTENDELVSQDILPNFTLKLSNIFRKPGRK